MLKKYIELYNSKYHKVNSQHIKWKVYTPVSEELSITETISKLKMTTDTGEEFDTIFWNFEM